MKLRFFIVFLLFRQFIEAQSMFIPMNNYYRDHFQRYSGKKVLETFYPATENQLALHDSMKDTTTLYYDFHQWLFKKHWLELKHPDYQIHIDPYVHGAGGKGFSDLDSSFLFRNTRGFYVEGNLLKNVGFQMMLAENQARFSTLESLYFNDRGEIYQKDTIFRRDNAVIPGGMRTKPFKVGAYDYAYSMGALNWYINQKWTIQAGNTPLFIGEGYRSLLLSDNAVAAPFLKINRIFSAKWKYQFVIRKQQNLYRKPRTFGIESVYEGKFFALSYLSFQPDSSMSVSLYTAGNQLLGDSLIKHPIHWNMVTPLPFMHTDLVDQKGFTNGLFGINISKAFKKLRLYGQWAFDQYQRTWLNAFQAGIFIPHLNWLHHADVRIEFNHIPRNFYADHDPKLAFSHFNLPSAHPKGNNFSEVLVITNWRYRRFYLRAQGNLYFSAGHNIPEQIAANSIFYVSQANYSSNTTLLTTIEGGYRINRKYNPEVYAQLRSRQNFDGNTSLNYLMALCGIKVSLFNQYLDF